MCCHWPWYFATEIETTTKREIGTRSGVFLVTDINMYSGIIVKGHWNFELEKPLSEYSELGGEFYKNIEDIDESSAEHGRLTCGVSQRTFESSLRALSSS